MPQWIVFYPPIDYRQINTILRSAAATIGRNPSGCLDTHHRHHTIGLVISISHGWSTLQHGGGKGVLGSNPSPATRKGHVMNRKTYGAHCSGWQRSMDERRHMVENLMLLAVVTVTVCGFLVLAFQPYAGPWSILAGFCCCTPLTFSHLLRE